MGKTVVQLGRDELIRAYACMRTIREFEARLQVEFAAGEMPGTVHPYGGDAGGGRSGGRFDPLGLPAVAG